MREWINFLIRAFVLALGMLIILTVMTVLATIVTFLIVNLAQALFW